MNAYAEERAALLSAADAVQASRADKLIARAHEMAAHINDPRDRLAHTVGLLQGELRKLCAELDPATDYYDPLQCIREARDLLDQAEAALEEERNDPEGEPVHPRSAKLVKEARQWLA